MILVGSTNALRIVRVRIVVNFITVILSSSFSLVLDTIRSGCHVVDIVSTFVAFCRLSLLRASLTGPSYWCYVRAVVLPKILKMFQYVHCNIARETAISSFVWAKTR